MSPDLKYLLYSVILTFIQMLVAALAADRQLGLKALAGNREGLPELIGFAGRARRAHANMIENMVLFAALVLIAAVAGKANTTTALGALIFFWGRVAHAIIYWIGIPRLRTLAWLVSVVGMIVIATQLF
ncbi:Uncharacterized conserved protein, MAPEG superfamily [Enhydrobacter aerosaccus]|uniref:Uncharacterized conserved protein, MAPEG superfamily n=1 Tax=Enhydrobacter aerosaccus TaxID=225324 RepID=A0A1T4RS31_9HYPH|nr:MAPEG family protein [Enhydrobacter aerosaccus]SKA18461.1 Uncharacterized conserved protein, MAPEG superfamily [Enhydrobacter aerosaccus]